MSNRVMYLVLLALLVVPSCKKNTNKPTGPSNVVQLGFISGLSGVTEPCGCTSKPLGGLDKMASAIESLKGPAFALAITGDTFFEYDVPPGHLVEQERAKAETIAEVLGALKPMAVLVGPRDFENGRDDFTRWNKEYSLPIFRSPRNVQTRFRADSVLHSVGGHKIGLIGIPGPIGLKEPSTITAGARGLRAQGAEIVIALLPIGGKDAGTFVGAIDGVDVAISGGDDSDELPKVVSGTLLVNGGIKGQHLGLLGIHWVDNPDWKRGFVFNDEVKAKRRSLQKRISRLTNAVQRLSPGPGRDVRETKLKELQAKLAELKIETPNTPYITWNRKPITKDIAAASWATARLAKYNRSLCEIVLDSTRDLICPPAAAPNSNYVGNAKCMNCHPQANEFYEKTAHAKAWKTLEDKGKTCDLGCIGCHTVGYEKPGGYCRLEDAEKNKNVGCENCHGPGAGHAASPFKREQWSPHFEAKPTMQTCLECHNEEHSDEFDFDKYLLKVIGPGHGQPMQ